MATARIGAFAVLDKQCVDEGLLRETLTVHNKAAALGVKLGIKAKNVVESYELWQECDGEVLVPRGTDLRALIPSGEIVAEPCPALRQLMQRAKEGRRFGPLLPLPLRFQLWDEQLAVIAAIEKGTANGRFDHLIQLGCGRGKTKLSVAYAAKHGLRTMIVVDQDFIGDQWRTAIASSTPTDPRAIGTIKGAKFRPGKRWTVASVQTLSRRIEEGYVGQEFFEGFDLVVFDEVHVAAAPTFLNVLPSFSCQRIGLSATPNRKDGLSDIFALHLGGREPTFCNVSRRRAATWAFREADAVPPGESRFLASMGERPTPRMHSLYIPTPSGYPRMNHALFRYVASRNEKWNEAIIRNLQNAVDVGRFVIVLGPTVEHMEHLHGMAVAAGIDSGLVVGKTKAADRAVNFATKRVLFCTEKLAYKALDVPSMNTLFLLYPSDDENFIMQASGRIDRGSSSPYVVTFVHNGFENLRRRTLRMKAIVEEIDPECRFA